MFISTATKQDIPAIQYLLASYGSKLSLDPALINNKDIALQARDESGKLIGFLWVGLMAKNTLGYMDKFCVDKDYSKKGVGKALALALKDRLVKRRVKTVFGIIRQDQYHDKSAMNALRMAVGGDQISYTYVIADVAHAIQELEMLGR